MNKVARVDKKVERRFLTIAIIVFLLILIYMVLPLFNIIVFSLILVFFLNSLYEFFNSKFKSEKVSALITISSVFLGAFLPLLIIFHFIILSTLEYLTNYVNTGGSSEQITTHVSMFLSVFLDSSVVESLTSSMNVREFFNENINSLIRIFNDSLSAYFHFIIGVFIVLFLSYYILIHKEDILKFLFSYAPLRKKKIQHILDAVALNLKILFKGYFLTGLAQTFMAFIGFVAFGVPNILIFTFLTFLTTLIPYIGTLLVWLPIGIYLIFSGKQSQGIGLIIYGILIVSTVDNFLGPILMSNKKTLPPILVFLGVVGGTLTFGIPGIILGPLIISICMTFIVLFNSD